MKCIIKTGACYGQAGTVKNCTNEGGEYYYYIKIKGARGIKQLHEKHVKIL